MEKRETFSSRLGFILISAGCAIGLGNVWRFPYITGKYGGAAFVLVYLVFLLILGLPIMVMEFSVGRASQKRRRSCPSTCWSPRAPSGTCTAWFGMAGNYLLMMFYTTVIAGWLLLYCLQDGPGTISRAWTPPGWRRLVRLPAWPSRGLMIAVHGIAGRRLWACWHLLPGAAKRRGEDHQGR